MEPTSADALRAMEEANRIIEDFPHKQYALYMFVFLVEIALCFWVALRI